MELPFVLASKYPHADKELAWQDTFPSEHLPWQRGSEEHSWTAWRNTNATGVVSAILVRTLLSALEGIVFYGIGWSRLILR